MTDPGPSPFKGLSAYEDSEVDALLFFGREREREVVVANLIASRLTILYGPSGVGKSSLLRAAVARSLRELPEHPLVVVFSQWSDDPARALAAAVADGRTPEAGLLGAVEQAQLGRDVYLVLDQAEEYFLYHADDEGPSSFTEALPALVTAPYRVNVLVSLREDALAKLDRFIGRIPGLFANTLRLDRLDRESARAAILRPVERYCELTGRAVAVEPALVERVLDEVGAGQIEPALGGLGAVEGGEDRARIEAPYLQLVMQTIWEVEQAQGSDTLRSETLERLGGAGRIVEEHLQGALERLIPPQKDIASRIFNHLVTPSGTKIAHETADLAAFGNVPVDELEPVLATLAERRILRSLEEGEHVRWEIFHDVLAQPVLAWRARHRTEREVDRELEEARRRRSRLNRILALGALAAVGLAVVVGFAVVQRSNANERERDAQARELDAAAIALLPEDPELSLLLAAESARMSPSPTAEDALLQALLTSRVRSVYDAGTPVGALAISPDGAKLAFASEGGRVSVRESSSGDEVASTEVGAHGRASFSDDGRLVVVRGEAGPASVVDAFTGASACELDEGRPQAGAMFEGEVVVTVRNGLASTWDPRSCERVRAIGRVGATAVTIVSSPRGDRVAFLSGPEARVVDVTSGRTRARLRHPGEITSLAFSEDGTRVVTGGRDKLVRVWNGRTGRLLHQLEGHSGQVLDVAMTPLGTEVASASTDGTARIWDVASGEFLAPLFGHVNFVRTVDFSPDGLSVVTASDDGTARTWALNGRRLATLAGHEGVLSDARFTADGFAVVTGGEDGTIRIWDSGTSPDFVLGDVEPPGSPATTATSPDGKATATIDGDVVLLERDGETVQLEGHDRVVSSVAFSPDGTRLVTAGRDNDARLWDVETGVSLRPLRGHFGAVNDARFSSDGRWLVTAGPRSAGLWRASDGRLVRLLYGPPGPYTAAAFRDGTSTIVAVTAEGVATYQCEVCGNISELLALAEERLVATGRELTSEERELYGD